MNAQEDLEFRLQLYMNVMSDRLTPWLGNVIDNTRIPSHRCILCEKESDKDGHGEYGHHIHPKGQGGMDTWHNIVFLCRWHHMLIGTDCDEGMFINRICYAILRAREGAIADFVLDKYNIVVPTDKVYLFANEYSNECSGGETPAGGREKRRKYNDNIERCRREFIESIT